MDRKTLMTLAVVLVILILMVVAVDSLMGGLPGAVKELYAQETAGLDQAAGKLKLAESRVDGLVGEDPDFLGPIEKREDWEARFEAASERIREARTWMNGDVTPLMEKNDSDDAKALSTRLQEIRAARMSALREAEAVRARAEKLVDFKKNRAAKVEEASKNREAFDAGAFAQLKSTAQQAAADWPEKKADIEERMQVFDALKKTASDSFAVVQEENKKPENRIDYEKLVGHAEAVKKAREQYDQSLASLPSLFGQLYVSWDKILEDMEIREGYEIEFFHTYKLIKVDRDNQPQTENLVQRVAKDFYLRHENDLGMTFESKPKGMYDFEAEKKVAPPGYNYVGNKEYGTWKRDASTGGSFWVFYGQYALMRNLLWGPSYYRPLYRSEWDSYRGARARGTTWYGRNASGKQVYGSKGALAKTKYAGSKYTSSGGYKSSQFKKSGGKYRGSRYASKASRSTSSSRSFSSGSRSSRSFGGK